MKRSLLTTLARLLRPCWLLGALFFIFENQTFAQQQFDPTNIILFAPTTGGYGFLSREYADVGRHFEPHAGLWLSYTHRPLIAVVGNAERIDIVSKQLTLDLVASIAFFKRFEIGFGLPIVPLQSGDGLKNTPDFAPFAVHPLSMGDMRLTLKVALLRVKFFKLAVQGLLTLPTGDQRNFTGERMVTGLPRLVSQFTFLDNRLVFSFDAGVKFRPKSQIGNINFTHELVLGTSLAYEVIKSRLQLGIELFSHSGFRFKTQQESPVVALAAAKVRAGQFVFSLGAGAGLTQGYGAPQFQIVGGVTFFPQRTNFAEEPEPLQEPDLPDMPLDVPSTKRVQVVVTNEKIDISERIFFEFDSDVISPISYPVLNKVSELVLSKPQLKRIRVEGHTDNKGTEKYNLDLSTRRARSVMEYLIAQGVDRDRLRYQGFGFSQPIDTNDTESGRARNRRVDFIIELQEQVITDK